MTVGNLGGAIGANIFLESQAPRYELGYGLSLAVDVAGIVAALVLRFILKRVNAKRDSMSEDEVRARYTNGKSAAASHWDIYRY